MFLLIVSTLAASWWGMQILHECGHLLGALATGGTVTAVDLPPLGISRTDVNPNPRPLFVVWSGPIVGAGLPVLAWGLAAALKISGRKMLQFFAGFCLIANGAYIGVGSFSAIGDCGVMLQSGSRHWQLWLFGAVTTISGLWMWHRLGKRMGLPIASEVTDRATVLMLAVALGLFAFCCSVTR